MSVAFRIRLSGVLPGLSVLLMLAVVFSSCVKPKPRVEILEEESLIPYAEEAENPRRSASMRLTEEGRKELSRSYYERAADRFGKAIEIDATNPFAYFYLGLTRFRVQNFRESIELFSRASGLFVDLDLWRAESIAYQALSWEKLGRNSRAEKLYGAALEIDRSNRRAIEGLQRLEENPSERNPS